MSPFLKPPPNPPSPPALAGSWRRVIRAFFAGRTRPVAVKRAVLGSMVCALGAASTGVAWAEKADRKQPIVIEADRSGTVDTQKQFTVFTGNVLITQGTLQVRAERVEIQESPDKFRIAVAFGSTQRPASFKQKRDGTEETVEGTAERIEFDEKADKLRLSGSPVVRRMLGPKMMDEVSGTLITWDNRTEFFTVDGGSPTAANPSGRVRMLMSPREAASGPAASPPQKTGSTPRSSAAPGR